MTAVQLKSGGSVYKVLGTYDTTSPSLNTIPNGTFLVNNTRSDIYAEAEFHGETRQLYNSAVLYDPNRNPQVEVMYIDATSSVVAMFQDSTRIHTYSRTIPNQHGCTLNKTFYVTFNDVSDVISDLPIFDNETDYLNYITNVFVPVRTSGGAGSGYIGYGSLQNKKMVGYNVPTSVETDTKTESVNVYSESKEANTPKAGNGHARIMLLKELFMLYDGPKGYKHSMMDDYVTPSQYSGYKFSFGADNLNSSGYGNQQICFNQKLRKGNAQNLYIETYGSYRNTSWTWWCAQILNSPDNQVYPSVYKKLTFVSYDGHYNIAGNDPWYNLPRNTYKFDLSEIPSDKDFYLGFHDCDFYGYVYRIFFDGTPEFLD